ncbi:MAG: hypothetical protein JXB00_15430 [Bacteroidales bacterium]|nr:hypothetical protein [Bacteroidales bacterium]
MIKVFLRIRIFQLFRFLNEIGILRLIVLLAISIYVSMLCINGVGQSGQVSIIPFLFGAVLFIIHTIRKDSRFLHTVFINPYPVYLFEYLVLSVPVFIISLVYKQWTGISGLMAICLLIPLFRIKTDINILSKWLKFIIYPFISQNSIKLKFKVPFVKPVDFEWISGIRKNLVILLPLYLFFTAFAFKAYFAPVGLILISFVISGFYLYGESRELIEIYAPGPGSFLTRKIYSSLRYLFILYAPIILVSLIFQPGTWYFLAFGLFISVSVQIFSVIFKYALFQEHASLNRNSILVALNTIFLLVPFFWPAPVFMGIKYYNKAKNNLENYFDDIN